MADRISQLLTYHQENPQDPFWCHTIGLEYARQKKTDQAIHWWEKAIACDPTYVASYYQLARAYLQQENIDLALQYAREGAHQAAALRDLRMYRDFQNLIDTLTEP
ncbi:MAG: tetratricopeptide repeat protein [Bacteroidia bacterium]